MHTGYTDKLKVPFNKAMESWSVFRLLTYLPRYVLSTQATSPSNILRAQGGEMGALGLSREGMGGIIGGKDLESCNESLNTIKKYA